MKNQICFTMQREGGQVNVTCLWIDDDIADILSAVDTVTGQATRLTPKEINAIHRFDLEENLELVGSNHELFIIDGGENGSE